MGVGGFKEFSKFNKVSVGFKIARMFVFFEVTDIVAWTGQSSLLSEAVSTQSLVKMQCKTYIKKHRNWQHSCFVQYHILKKDFAGS